MAKMTIEEFRKIKQRMIDYLNKNARNQDEEELISGYYAIQEELGVNIPDEKANEFETVGDAYNFIKTQM
jgi:acyl carrier protein